MSAAPQAQKLWVSAVLDSSARYVAGFHMTDSRPQQVSSVVRELETIEQDLVKAWVDGDREAIGRVLAPDWTVTGITGRVMTKAQVMDEMFAGTDRPIAAMTVDDVAVRVFGDAAVVTGRTVARGNSPGAAPVELRFTDVFVRQDGRWLAVASQGTPVAR
jgi:uncharacterized protein (TIGR02246 family)